MIEAWLTWRPASRLASKQLFARASWDGKPCQARDKSRTAGMAGIAEGDLAPLHVQSGLLRHALCRLCQKQPAPTSSHRCKGRAHTQQIECLSASLVIHMPLHRSIRAASYSLRCQPALVSTKSCKAASKLHHCCAMLDQNACEAVSHFFPPLSACLDLHKLL